MKRLALCLSLLCLFCSAALHAQQKDAAAVPHPQKIKVLQEFTDGKGHIVRVVQFTEGLMRVTQTIIMPIQPKISYNIRIPILADTMKKEEVKLVVVKGDYNLQVWYRKKLIRVYRAVFGPHPLQDKVMEGDRCTPEGQYTITLKNGASKYDRFMGISYPNDSTQLRFKKMKAAGTLPATATIGGNVGIHGIWPGGDDMIEMGVGWTDGCIALKNKDIEELYTFVGVGTKVWITK